MEAPERNAVPGFRRVDEGIFAGGRPDAAGMRWLAAAGIKTVVNLERSWIREETRAVQRERKQAESLGICMVSMPVRPLLTPGKEMVDRIVAFIADPRVQPVYIHCTRGKDRTGVIVAAYRVRVQGVRPEEAYREMVRNGFSRFLFWFRTFLFGYAKTDQSRR